MAPGKVTVIDVARLAGVSPATVDRVVNRRGGVAEDKEKRVVAAAKSLGFRLPMPLRPSRMLRVAVLMQSPANPFHAALRRGFDVAGRLHADLNLQFLVHHIDPNAPERIAGMIADLGRRHDGLIVTSPNHPLIAEALSEVSGRRPVVTLATDVDDSGRAAYVGPDDRRAGRVAGDLMGRFLRPSGGEVAIVAGLRGIGGHRDRERGFVEVLAEFYPEIRVTEVIETGERFERAGDLVHALLGGNRHIRGLYHLSAGARPVVEAIRALGRHADMALITHELTDDRRALLRARAIDAVIDQNPEFEVRAAVETMARLLGRLDGTPGDLMIPVQIYTPENA